MNPLVSIVITTYNQGAYIEQTIRSVLSQTYSPYEVIVVDDGSTDDTPARISPFEREVIYIRQENQGVAGSRNTGIRKAKGDYIAFLDGDDLWLPEKLSVQVEAAIRYPDSGLIVVDGTEFTDDRTISTSVFFETWCRNLHEDSVTSGDYYRQIMKCNFISTTSQVMVPAKVFEKIGLSDPKFRRASDYDLYIRIASEFRITIIKKRLMQWRYLPSSVSGLRVQRNFRYLPEDIRILKNHLRDKSGDDRSSLREIINGKLIRGSESLYYFGSDKDRVLATRYLLNLLLDNISYPVAGVYLAGLWCPDCVTRKLGQSMRRLLSV